MLDELHVENVALIRDASFAPSSGLTVITGETGSGKTALLSAIKLLVGERADAATVREGESAASVEGRFFLRGEDAPDGHVVVRKVGADGRSRVSIDGSMATVGQLASRIGSTVDLCGQHEHQRLLKASSHLAMLDAWAGEDVAAALASYKSAFAVATEAKAELERVQEASRASSAQLEEARFIVQRIDEVGPSVEEYEEIRRELPRVENAEALAQAADAAYWGLSGDGGAVSSLNSAIMQLEYMQKMDPTLSSACEALSEASYILEDAARDVRAYRDGIDHDPASFARLQERMSAFQGLMRAYGPRMEDVMERRERAADLVSSVDDAQERVAQATQALDAAEEVLALKAADLDAARSAAAPLFAERVNAFMDRLEMGGAELVCQFAPLEREKWTSAGSSKFEFAYRPSASMTARPLARIASGGEVSRVMLAVKAALGAVDEGDTLVFDEVDAGVGGSVALALADVLADLAETHQVIVVTHLAQVAVRAQTHYLVSKNVAEDGSIPETTLAELDEEGRVLEVARMLSGNSSEASCAHAKEMLGMA